MPELNPLEKKIVEIAKKSFISNGIINTEMKDIAAAAGISRSSLYRHFPSSLYIAFYVLNDVLGYLVNIDEKISDELTGYEQFSLYMSKAIDKLCDNLNMVRFIREFDTLYNLKENLVNPPDAYYSTLFDYSRYQFIEYFRKGQRDGSMKRCENEVNAALTFYFAAQSMTEHIMLREKNYIQEHGAAKEFVQYTIELMLAGIKAQDAADCKGRVSHEKAVENL